MGRGHVAAVTRGATTVSSLHGGLRAIHRSSAPRTRHGGHTAEGRSRAAHHRGLGTKGGSSAPRRAHATSLLATAGTEESESDTEDMDTSIDCTEEQQIKEKSERETDREIEKEGEKDCLCTTMVMGPCSTLPSLSCVSVLASFPGLVWSLNKLSWKAWEHS